VQCSSAGCCDPNDKDTKVKLGLDHVMRRALLALGISILWSPGQLFGMSSQVCYHHPP
jgi:hypothetical protein